MIVLSHFQIRPLIKEWRSGKTTCLTSTNLNLTTESITLSSEGILYPDGHVLTWNAAQEIANAENKCFQFSDGQITQIQMFSETTNWLRTLFPTERAPTMLVAGMTMHRIKQVDPYQDTLNKIRAASPVGGRVLDTATGLGYTAIEAARTAEEVITVEIDPTSIEIARLNPWSQELFSNQKITQIIGDVWDIAEDSEDGTFSIVIHDPPTFSLAGELYSTDFYAELYRILKGRGRLFHYIGDPDSKSGQNTTRGVIRRLQEVGFSRIARKPEAYGVLAFK